ncbi:MAG: DUF362 domain-containing protein [Lacunisphaera sp.]|nr:DUF362 domain-containing protein [Lacunisphaera sp.]
MRIPTFFRRGLATCFAVGACVVAVAQRPAEKPGQKPFPEREQVFVSIEGSNKPMGEGFGLFPGRVVWVQNFNATKWDGKTGKWWDEPNIDQPTVEAMLSQTMHTLTGAKDDAEAWDKLFRDFNKTHGRGDRGYRPGEKITIKVNMNPDEKDGEWTNAGFPSPHTSYALMKQLIEKAGVPGACITITDPSRPIKDMLLYKIRGDQRSDFQKIVMADRFGGEGARIKAEPDLRIPVHFEIPHTDGTIEKTQLFLPKVYTEADYLIDYCVVRPHRVFGLTISFKNHFGAVYNAQKQRFTPDILHAFAIWDYATPYTHGHYNGLVPLLGHKHVGGKTLFYFAEGLYTSPNQSTATTVVRWKTYGDRWFSSMLASQDPVALDSVGLDLVTTEPNLTMQPDGRPNPSFNGNIDGYLHEAALAGNPPSGAVYDPEMDGSPLQSLGIHEHWNNATDKQYSRNLGKGTGIELIQVK